ncbi:hypothetical protein V8C86DRAFT_3147057 [Haematococcus lacustris]
MQAVCPESFIYFGFVHLESHDAEHQCAKLIECLKAAGYWTADVKILFAVCGSAASNVGKHSGVVMRLAAAKIKAGHQWAASMHLRYLEREQLLGHLEGEDASKYDPMELHKMTANLEVTRDTDMLTPAMEQLLSRYYRATHMTNAVPETMLKQLNNDNVLRMNAEGMSGRAKLAMEDTTLWVADGVLPALVVQLPALVVQLPALGAQPPALAQLLALVEALRLLLPTRQG